MVWGIWKKWELVTFGFGVDDKNVHISTNTLQILIKCIYSGLDLWLLSIFQWTLRHFNTLEKIFIFVTQLKNVHNSMATGPFLMKFVLFVLNIILLTGFQFNSSRESVQDMNWNNFFGVKNSRMSITLRICMRLGWNLHFWMRIYNYYQDSKVSDDW